MFFCPKCSYLLDINKINKINTDNKEILDLTSSNLKKIINNQLNLKKYNINFTIYTLEKNNYYKKLSNENKMKLKKSISTHLNNNLNNFNVQFNCKNCEWNEPITETKLLYKMTVQKYKKEYTQHDFKLLVKDPTLPRTKDYTCKNLKCITNIPNNKIQKEAVFMRNSNSYALTYICTICNFGWSN